MNTFRIFATENQVVATTALCQLIDELAEIGSLASSVILSALEDPNPSVRGFAARALGRLALDTPPVIDGLTMTLKDSDTYVRQCAAAALGAIHPSNLNAAEALHEALCDQDPDVSAFANETLKQMPHFSGVYPLFGQTKYVDFSCTGEYCSVAFG